MDPMRFQRMRTAIQANASPGKSPELRPVQESLRDLLMSSGLFDEVEVEHTDDPDQLVIALCKFHPEFTEGEVAQRLEAIWSEGVSYRFWEAHALRVEYEHVELEAASRASSQGHYVTVHLVAQRSRIPAQRVSSD
ncbi:hypothetical protein BH18ACT9_BH18ACT9_16610 [soil metagenome]